jgi:tetratricopeptide (TPR) repeat protein
LSSFNRTKAVTLRSLGRAVDAEKILRDCFKQDEPKKPDSLDYTNLGTILKTKGQHQEAMDLYSKVINKLKGKESEKPALLLTQHRQAELYSEIGQPDHAIEILEEVFDEKISSRGICATATLTTGISLQRLLRSRDRFEEAEAIATTMRPYLQYA